MSALRTTNGLGSNGRKLIVQITFKERPARDFETFQAQHQSPETLLGRNAAEDEMRMLVTWRNKSACYLDARMAGLDGLLGRGQIPANESVDVRSRRFLVIYL